MKAINVPRAPKIPYRNVYIYFALLIPAVLLAFAKSYFAGVTFSGLSVTPVVHVHAALMVLWLFMLVGQAWLIRGERFRVHRWVGRSSYVIAPTLVVVGLVAAHATLNAKTPGITLVDARLEAYTLGQLLGFGLAWALAILYRKRTELHVRFMVSTTFAFGSAIVFRIILNWFGWVPGLDTLDNIAAANWAVLTLPLLALIALDYRAGLKRSPYWVVTIVIGIMHVGYFTFTKSDGWFAFVRWYAALPLS